MSCFVKGLVVMEYQGVKVVKGVKGVKGAGGVGRDDLPEEGMWDFVAGKGHVWTG